LDFYGHARTLNPERNTRRRFSYGVNGHLNPDLERKMMMNPSCMRGKGTLLKTLPRIGDSTKTPPKIRDTTKTPPKIRDTTKTSPKIGDTTKTVPRRVLKRNHKSCCSFTDNEIPAAVFWGSFRALYKS
jgi:hypothetical protein